MIEIDGLIKRYGHHTVVDDLSFQCGSGEVLGFLGPNGAGKSTTMKMVTGFVTPDAGRVSVCGHDVQSDPIAARRQMGYLPEGAPCYAEMTPLTFLEFIADVRGIHGEDRRRRLAAVVEQLNLETVLKQSIETLSKGFKRRVGLAQAILHDPKVLILDEPTDGLDPNQKHEVRELIRSMSADKLIVISTHILEEVEAVCSRAIIIAAGKILADDTPANLAARSSLHNSVQLMLENDGDFDRIRAALEQLPTVQATQSDRQQKTITALASDRTAGGSTWNDVSELARDSGWPLRGVHQQSGHLNDVFREITQGAVV